MAFQNMLLALSGVTFADSAADARRRTTGVTMLMSLIVDKKIIG
jgi:hypothetical protein